MNHLCPDYDSERSATMKKFHPSTIPMHEQVRDHLMERLQTGELKPGQPLPPERKLAEELGVSRHTVRQALSSLESFGLIEIRHGSGIYVTETTSDEAVIRVAETVIDRGGSILDVTEVRRGIEPFAARLAAERRTEADLERLERLIPYVPDDEVGPAHQGHTSFHREIAIASHNPVYDGVMRMLITGPRRAEALIKVVPAARSAWEDQHRGIFLAIRDGDAELAERLMAAHIDDVRDAVKGLQAAKAI